MGIMAANFYPFAFFFSSLSLISPSLFSPLQAMTESKPDQTKLARVSSSRNFDFVRALRNALHAESFVLPGILGQLQRSDFGSHSLSLEALSEICLKSVKAISISD